MSRFIQVITKAKEPIYSDSIRRLNKMAGDKPIDINYMADVMRRGHAFMREIKLDPRDTKPAELIRALEKQINDGHLLHRLDDVALIEDDGKIISFNYHDIKRTVRSNLTAYSSMYVRRDMQKELARRYIKAGCSKAVVYDHLILAGFESLKKEK